MSFRDGDYSLEESQRLEFKEAAGGLPNDLWETYSAFANTEGGEIVLGVSEDKASHAFSLVGVSNASDMADLVWTSIRNPKVVGRDILLSDSVSVVSRDGLDFVVVNVPRAEREERPVEVYDRPSKSYIAYIRRGTVDQKASKDDLFRMDYDKAAEADRRALEDFSLDCLCEETIQRYRTIFAGHKSTSPWNADSREDFLYHIGAVVKGKDSKMHPTKAGLLAFGYEYEITRYLPQFLLDYREETSGATRWDDRICSQSGDWSGNAVDFYLSVTERLLRYILRSNELNVTNTGDFLIDRNVAIAGGFSETRNPTLMRMLSLIGATDRAGSGLQTIWSVWGEIFGDEPILEEYHSPSYVQLSLPFSDRSSDESRLRESVHDAAIIELLRARPSGLYIVDFEDALGVSERVAQKTLKDLRDKEIVRGVREGRKLRYYLA